jgi:hypothetical protein
MGDGIKLFLLCLVIWLIPWIAIPVILLWLGLNWEPRDEECSIIITVPASEIKKRKQLPRNMKDLRVYYLTEVQREINLALTQSTKLP